MYNRWELGLKFLKYYLTASNGKGHGIHSPFVFDLVEQVLNDQRRYYAYDQIESLRQRMLKNESLLEVVDWGAGSSFTSNIGAGEEKEGFLTSPLPTGAVDHQNKIQHKSVSSLTKRTAKSPKLAQLLFRIVHHYQLTQMLELGTSMGISGAYLAKGNIQGELLTIEGAPAVAEQAQQHFNQLGIQNIVQVVGNFDVVLPQILEKRTQPFDLVYLDGNHRYEATKQYFSWLLPHMQQDKIAFMIFDDIHWSAGMEKAWKEIAAHPSVFMSIDLFFLGLVVFSPQFLHKQYFIIRF